MKDRKVLIVDDEKSFTEMMKMNLEDEGFVVRIENESTHALDAVREFAPDVVLLDIVMPNTDGCDILKQMQADPGMADIPTIMVSALVSNREVGGDAALDTPSARVIAKPVRFEKLRKCIDEALSVHP